MWLQELKSLQSIRRLQHRLLPDVEQPLQLQDQANSDGVLDDIACMLSCTRTSLRSAFP